MKKALLYFCLFISWIAEAEIVETQHFNEIHTFLLPGTLVILDIDDTLLIPVQMLGCDEWFLSRLRSHQKEGRAVSECLEKSLAEWEAVRHLTKMEIVERGTEIDVRKLQEQGFVVMGLTTQGLALATRTKMQLMDNQIDLSRSAPSHEDHYFIIDGHGVLYRAGILFTSGSHKGKALFKLFEELGYTPRRILFINDKRTHLLSVEEITKEKDIEFVGLRYGYSDARKAAFDEKLAHYQFTHSTFTHLLSDEEAREQLDH